jgi:GTPase
VATADQLQLITEEELNAAEPAPEKLLANLAAAEQMAPRDGATAFILSWAALESALRRAVLAARLDVVRETASRLVGALYNGKLLDGDELIRLRASVKVRNALVRGLAVPAPGPSAVQEVADVARRLLAQNGKAPGS